VEARDLATLIAACVVVLAAAFAAAYVPARRAPRVDPTAALRAEQQRIATARPGSAYRCEEPDVE
jgi:hypothetical protein